MKSRTCTCINLMCTFLEMHFVLIKSKPNWPNVVNCLLLTLNSSVGVVTSWSTILYENRVAARLLINSGVEDRWTKSGWLWYRNRKNCIRVTGYSCIQAPPISSWSLVYIVNSGQHKIYNMSIWLNSKLSYRYRHMLNWQSH